MTEQQAPHGISYQGRVPVYSMPPSERSKKLARREFSRLDRSYSQPTNRASATITAKYNAMAVKSVIKSAWDQIRRACKFTIVIH